MNAAEIIQMARAAGVSLQTDGADLLLEAEAPPSTALLEHLAQYKPAVIALLTAEGDDGGTATDWQVLYAERSAIAEHDGGRARQEADEYALEVCIFEWLSRHPSRSDPGSCAWCDRPDQENHAVVPIGASDSGSTWLHPECWEPWYARRREQARRALAQIGIPTASTRAQANAAALGVVDDEGVVVNLPDASSHFE